MMAVPRRPRRPADGEAETPVNGTLELPMMPSAATENGRLAHPPAASSTDLAVPVRGAKIEAHAAEGAGPQLAPDPGLYAVLGLEPDVADALIQTTYRRQAARLLGSGSNDNAALRQLNVAYEVLGNPVRRAEYDRMRLTQSSSGPPTPIRAGAKVGTRVTRRRRRPPPRLGRALPNRPSAPTSACPTPTRPRTRARAWSFSCAVTNSQR